MFNLLSVTILTLVFSSTILPVSASWFIFGSSEGPENHSVNQVRDEQNNQRLQSSATLSNVNITTEALSAPTPSILSSSNRTQSTTTTSLIPIYEICNLPATATGNPESNSAESTSCSTAYETVITPLCSTTLTGFFTKVTITDCNQNITFSTRTIYSLASATASSSLSPIPERGYPDITESGPIATSLSDPKTHVDIIIVYYIALWSDLVSGTPSEITVKTCDSEEICEEHIQEWELEEEVIQVTKTTSISISESLRSGALLQYNAPEPTTLTVPKGDFQLTTAVVYTSPSRKTITKTSVKSPSSTDEIEGDFSTKTTVSTRTTTVTAGTRTVTRTVSLVEGYELTMTLSSTTTLTTTITVQADPTQ